MKIAIYPFMILLVMAMGAGYGCGPNPAQKAEPKQIFITAKRFEFNPAEIRLKAGVPVLLQLRSLDRLHGFAIPALGIRADVPAGETVQVLLTPQVAGEYVFLCDIFCGSGHGEMGGRILVLE